MSGNRQVPTVVYTDDTPVIPAVFPRQRTRPSIPSLRPAGCVTISPDPDDPWALLTSSPRKLPRNEALHLRCRHIAACVDLAALPIIEAFAGAAQPLEFLVLVLVLPERPTTAFERELVSAMVSCVDYCVLLGGPESGTDSDYMWKTDGGIHPAKLLAAPLCTLDFEPTLGRLAASYQHTSSCPDDRTPLDTSAGPAIPDFTLQRPRNYSFSRSSAVPSLVRALVHRREASGLGGYWCPDCEWTGALLAATPPLLCGLDCSAVERRHAEFRRCDDFTTSAASGVGVDTVPSSNGSSARVGVGSGYAARTGAAGRRQRSAANTRRLYGLLRTSRVASCMGAGRE